MTQVGMLLVTLPSFFFPHFATHNLHFSLIIRELSAYPDV